MSLQLQIITLGAEPVALITSGQAMISRHIDPDLVPVVDMMCLYALEILDGDRHGPYSDQAALAYALARLEQPVDDDA